jgi:hypothetical protein
MKFRTLFFAAASIATLSPSLAQASTENAALGACARAFAASMASPGASAPSFKLKYRSSQASSSIVDYYNNGAYTFELQARDVKTGATLARATCTANTRGAQVALTATPLNGSEATLAAR